jgi:hypothetical protein
MTKQNLLTAFFNIRGLRSVENIFTHYLTGVLHYNAKHMAKNVARRHHYVPEFLLRPWLTDDDRGQKVLRGYYWDDRRNLVVCKARGLKSFCNQIDLLTLTNHPQGRDALEKVFFGDVDDNGARVRDILVQSGPVGLTNEQRSDFARLLMSLEARRPTVVDSLRQGGDHFTKTLNGDPSIVAALEKAGIRETPAQRFEQRSGRKLEDRSLSIIQRLVDNPDVGSRLVRARWEVRHLGKTTPPLILSDRPFIRFNASDAANAVWILPLSQKAVFVAAAHPAVPSGLLKPRDDRFARLLNVSSARQVERFAFSSNVQDQTWLGKYLKPEVAKGRPWRRRSS